MFTSLEPCSLRLNFVRFTRTLFVSSRIAQKCLRAKQAPFTKKTPYFCSKKLRFVHFLLNCKMKMISLKQYFSNLLNKLLHMETCLIEAIFILQCNKKCIKCNFLEQKYIFYKCISFRLQTYLSLRTLLLTYSKLVGLFGSLKPCSLRSNYVHFGQIMLTLLKLCSLRSNLVRFARCSLRLNLAYSLKPCSLRLKIVHFARTLLASLEIKNEDKN